jgi:hypothetical protein
MSEAPGRQFVVCLVHRRQLLAVIHRVAETSPMYVAAGFPDNASSQVSADLDPRQLDVMQRCSHSLVCAASTLSADD